MSNWRTIDSAPKDGTEFQAWTVLKDGADLEGGIWEPCARFNPESEAFEIWTRVDYDQDGWQTDWFYPTHWQPLPAPPEPSSDT